MRKIAAYVIGMLLVASISNAISISKPAYASPITLTPITTGFNNPIGIDHHEPTNKVVMSVNYPSGLPYNFELVAADGTRTQFSTISGLTDEVKIASVRSSSCTGGFTVGELFTGSGVPGVIVRISPDGSTIKNPWVTLPGESGLLRGSLFQDRYCSFNGDLIVVTTAGNVWRVNSAGTPTLLASIGTHLEGVTTVPNDPAKYGPWAGKILAGAEQQSRIYAIDSSGNVEFYELGINPEDIDIIPDNENFFGVDFGGATLWGASPSEFDGMEGDVLIAQEFPGILWHVRWDGNQFQVEQLAQVSVWEHVTFSKAGIVEIPPVNELGIKKVVRLDQKGIHIDESVSFLKDVKVVEATLVDPSPSKIKHVYHGIPIDIPAHIPWDDPRWDPQIKLSDGEWQLDLEIIAVYEDPVTHHLKEVKQKIIIHFDVVNSIISTSDGKGQLELEKLIKVTPIPAQLNGKIAISIGEDIIPGEKNVFVSEVTLAKPSGTVLSYTTLPIDITTIPAVVNFPAPNWAALGPNPAIALDELGLWELDIEIIAFYEDGVMEIKKVNQKLWISFNVIPEYMLPILAVIAPLGILSLYMYRKRYTTNSMANQL